MFGKITLLFLGLVVQEIISFNALIFATHHGLYNPILVHILFLVATIFDIGIGYWIGLILRKKTHTNKVTISIQKISDRFSLSTKKYRRWTMLFLLGNFSFPYINSCIAGYLGMPFWESSFFIFLGDLVWYVSIWLVVLGVSSVIKNLPLAFLGVIIISVIIMVIIRKFNIRKI